jgi:hypothetical protein
MAVTRVHSSDCQVFVPDVFGNINERLPLVQSLSISTSKDVTNLQPLGQFGYTDRILNANQTTELSLDHLISTGVSGINPFYEFQEQQEGFLSVSPTRFKIKDNAGESLISGAYLNSYNLNGSVGEVVKGSMSYEADTITFNAENTLTDADESDDSLSQYNVFRPRNISITTTAGLASEGIESSALNIQSFDLSASVGREAKNRVGSRIPAFRYPTLPAEGSLDFSIIKNQVTGINLSNLVLEKGTIEIDLRDGEDNSVMNFTTSGCSLVDVSESFTLDANATLDFSYVFSIQY